MIRVEAGTEIGERWRAMTCTTMGQLIDFATVVLMHVKAWGSHSITGIRRSDLALMRCANGQD
jgi:hypothetical protein